MAPMRLNPSAIGNKMKREQVYKTAKREKKQEKLKRRIQQAELEKKNPELREVGCFNSKPWNMTSLTYLIQERRAKNIPNTLDNMREFDPSMLTANPVLSNTEASNSNESQPVPDDEIAQDIANDPFAAYFDSTYDPSTPPKVLITTSPQAGKATYEFCDEIVGVFPGAEFVRRKKGKGFELGRIAGWASGRGYGSMVVINEDHKKPSKRAIYWNEEGELMDRVGRCNYSGSFTKWTNCLLQAFIYRTHQANLCVCFPPASIAQILNLLRDTQGPLPTIRNLS